MPRIAALAPLRSYWCSSNGPRCFGCHNCTKGVVLSARLQDHHLEVMHEANGVLHRPGCASASPSAVERRVSLSDLSRRPDTSCGCLDMPPAEQFEAQHRPLQQALGGIMRCALAMSVPTANQLTRWRNAIDRATHPAWRDLPGKAASVLDVVTGADTTVTPLERDELRSYAAGYVMRAYGQELDFGTAADWWPRRQLEDVRKAYVAALDSARALRGRVCDTDFGAAAETASKKLDGMSTGRPGLTLDAMFDEWASSISGLADPAHDTVLRINVQRGDVDGSLEPLLVAYQAAATMDEGGRLGAVLIVPRVVCRFLMTDPRFRRVVTDLGEYCEGDHAVADLALGLMSEMAPPHALEAARRLGG